MSVDAMRAGGQQLRELREAMLKTQHDVETATLARFGRDSRVYAQQVSRIEKGQVDKPPILDLIRIGAVLGLEPDDIAEMFHLWPVRQRAKLDPRLKRLILLAESLPFAVREQLLTQVEFACALAEAGARSRADGEPNHPTA